MAKSKKKSLKASTSSILPTLGATGTWLYGGYPGSNNDTSFNESKWLSGVVNTINTYNTNASLLKITQVYAYATDIELPWTAQGSSPTYWDETTQYGYYFSQDSSSVPLPLFSASSITPLTDLNIIIDGRIDNGYLQGFNDQISTADANSFASLIVSGGNSQSAIQPGVASYGPTQTTNKPQIKGVQFDLEPFDSTSANQLEFYHKAGNLLAAAGQYFSVFTFPKSLNQATADMLNGTTTYTFYNKTTDAVRNNGYAIISLYDLIDMSANDLATCQASANQFNTSGICDTGNTSLPMTTTTGDATGIVTSSAVPHSLQGYYNAALLTVQQTIALAKLYSISYKFAIPGSASVHEFENWGTYACEFSDKSPENATCKETAITQTSTTKQSDYIKQAIKAIQTGFNGSSDPLFLGIDIYAFSAKQVWSPQPPLADWNQNFYYGNTCTSVTAATDLNPAYIYTAPNVPTQDVLLALENVTAINSVAN